MSISVDAVKNSGYVASVEYTEQNNKQKEPIDVKQGSEKTQAYQATLKHLQDTKVVILETIEAQIKIAKQTGKPDEAKKLEGEKAKLLNIYQNTNYKISADGTVEFSFTQYADFKAEDFKKAYGIKDGSLQKYLRSRHSQDIKTGKAHITSATIVQGGLFNKSTKTVTPEDYEHKSYSQEEPMNHKEHLEDNDNKLYDDFLNNEDSTIKYSDGYSEKCEHGLFSGYNFGHPDYRGMSFDSSDKFTLSPKNFK